MLHMKKGLKRNLEKEKKEGKFSCEKEREEQSNGVEELNNKKEKEVNFSPG